MWTVGCFNLKKKRSNLAKSEKEIIFSTLDLKTGLMQLPLFYFLIKFSQHGLPLLYLAKKCLHSIDSLQLLYVSRCRNEKPASALLWSDTPEKILL
jgi:hypothetical protein